MAEVWTGGRTIYVETNGRNSNERVVSPQSDSSSYGRTRTARHTHRRSSRTSPPRSQSLAHLIFQSWSRISSAPHESPYSSSALLLLSVSVYSQSICCCCCCTCVCVCTFLPSSSSQLFVSCHLFKLVQAKSSKSLVGKWEKRELWLAELKTTRLGVSSAKKVQQQQQKMTTTASSGIPRVLDSRNEGWQHHILHLRVNAKAIGLK